MKNVGFECPMDSDSMKNDSSKRPMDPDSMKKGSSERPVEPDSMKKDSSKHPVKPDFMKKYVSIYALLFRCTILPILFLWIAMCIVMTALFLWNMNRGIIGIEDIISQSWFYKIAMIFWLLLILIFFTQESNLTSGSQVQYTLTRLSVSEKEIFFIWTLYHLVIQLISWGLLLILSFLLCQFYVRQASPELVNAQTIYMAFCRDSFLYHLLPLALPYRLWMNLFVLISMSIIISSDAWVLRRQKKIFNTSLLACIWIKFSCDEVFLRFSFQDALLIGMLLFLLVLSFIRISKSAESQE